MNAALQGPATLRRLHGMRGMTLPEVMVALAIVGILASIGLPAFRDLIAGQRVKTVSTDIYSSLLRARGEALKRNVNVAVSPVDTAWTKGWNMPNPSDTTTYIEQHGAVASVTITGPSVVTYRSSGRVLETTEPSFDISASNTSVHRCIKVDLSGRPYVKNTSC